MTNRFNDPTYLRNEQYKTSSNLSARAALHARFSTNPYGWMRWVFDQLNLPPQARVLELGGGPGGMWIYNAARIPAGWTITLSDFSEGMVEEQQRNLALLQRPLEFKVIDIQSIPFPDATFDGVIANHMLYHVPDRAKGIAEVHRVLKPDGVFYATTTGKAHMREMDELVERFTGVPLLFGQNNPFMLDNGRDQLEPFFARVEVRTYEDSLEVTEVEPLIAYILSSITKSQDVQAVVPQFRDFLTQKLAAHGSFHITKYSGMFVSYK
jgi:ubiquinone/menaquinone biosynthesis C-methylase UbiE